MRAIWTGAVSFGLVNIPVKMFSASQDSRLDLDMLDKRDQARIRFKRVNEASGKEVAWDDIVKAYNYEGQYIILNDEDFEQANAKKFHTIEIMNFVNQDEIEPIYFADPYYLEPEKSGVRAYAVLREALANAGKVGIASFVMRTKETLAALKPMDNVIVLSKLRFCQEIRDRDELEVPPEKMLLKPAEIKMAEKLIDEYTEPFDISEIRDTYSDELMRIIEAKAKGKQSKIRKLEIPSTKSKDLMAQLKASLEQRKKKAS